MNDSPVVIVGGGVAGLAMANALAVRGFSSIVIEKTKSPGEIDRGDVLHHSTLSILKRWRVYESLQAYTPLEFTRFQILNNNGKEILRFDLNRDLCLKAKFTVLRHPVIESFLEETAVRTGLVSIMRSVVCTSLMLEDDRVVGVTTSTGNIGARLTIIANGAKSALRDKHFKGRFHHEYPVSFYNARYRLISDFADTGLYVIGKGGVMILVPLPNGEMRIGLQYPKRERVSPHNVADTIRARLRTFPSQPLKFIDAHIYPVTMSLSGSLFIPGAVLIGDTAHTVHPVGGQGMNLAFQDAEMLAQNLADSGQNTTTFDEACGLYSYERRRQLRQILARIHFLAQWSLIENPLLISFRETLLKSANKSLFIKRFFFNRVVDVS